MKVSKLQIVIVLLFLVLIIEIIYGLFKNNMIQVQNINAVNDSKLKDELIITMFMKNIKMDSSKYYDNYFKHKLTYYDYETKIISIKRGNESERRFIYITFGSTPMIGAHNPVGYDEIAYKVDVLGNITFENFLHLKSFDIPEWLRSSMIKQYPEIQ